MTPIIRSALLCMYIGMLSTTGAMAQSYLAFHGRIDTTLYRSVDVTGDGIPDTVELHLNAPDFKSPFNWSLQIWSQRHDLLYSFTESDSDTDNMLQLQAGLDSDLTYNANDWKRYLLLKYNLFFKDFAGLKVNPHMDWGIDTLEYDSTYDGSIYQTAGNFLFSRCHMSKQEARGAIQRVVLQLKKGKLPIVTHDEGLETALPMVYFPECKKLVPIWSD